VKLFNRDQTAQALIEIAFIMPILCVMTLGVVDYSRAIYDTEVITNLAGEGASLASRGTSPTNAVAAIMSEGDINMNGYGCAVLTAVSSPSAGTYQVVEQAYSTACNGGTSNIGCLPTQPGCKNNNATVPPAIQDAFKYTKTGYVIYIAEVYYNFSSATGIGSFLHGNGLLPSRMYAVAYY
jgi:hypothetical protein